MSTELSGLPKQWLHWAQSMGLKPESRGKRFRRWKGHYMVGRGHRWRVNDRGCFQISCARTDFDRWANSVGAEVELVPTTKKQFQATVRLLHGTMRLMETKA